MRRRPFVAPLALMLVLVPLAAVTLLMAAGAASAPPTNLGAFLQTETISREHLINGRNVVADQRTVKLAITRTQNLQGLRQIDVSWSGARPSILTGRTPDVNSVNAALNIFYPMVILECRGVDRSDIPASQHLDQTTCWTSTSVERYQANPAPVDRFPPWRVDRYASPDHRQALVGRPTPIPPTCAGNASVGPLNDAAENWVPFRGSDGTVYAGGPAGDNSGAGCNSPAESGVRDGTALPSNETFAPTAANGTGSAKFDIFTAENNSSLGCSETVACSLVAIPVEGISCDVGAQGLPPQDRPPIDESAASEHFPTVADLAEANCTGDFAGTGIYWWSASNWRNRIVVPLTFAPTGNPCDVVSKAGVDIYGSELMTEATRSWAPHFCLDPKLFKFTHVQFSDTNARSLVVNGKAEAAFSSDIPTDGFPGPMVSAPVAVTGFAISYAIDGRDGNPISNLKLSPRLLAKLLTESYGVLPNRGTANLAADPEFQALNPGLPTDTFDPWASAALLALSSDGDVMAALTAYLINDPETKAWLDGAPDPWGMSVNPHYTLKSLAKIGITLPTPTWPLLDTFTTSIPSTNPAGAVLNAAPLLPTVEAPVGRLSRIAADIEFAIDRAATVGVQVGGTDGPIVPVAFGRQPPGLRFRLGVTTISAARALDLSTAALQTSVAPAVANAKFTKADGRIFVGPTVDSLHAAAKLLSRDATTGLWPIPYQKILTTPDGASAYPGTMVVYAQAPTTGLPAADAGDLATFLRFAAGAGQTPGEASGQIPDGYLPMTSANDLGALASFTNTAADAVAAQAGGNGDPPTSTVSPSATPASTLSDSSTNAPQVAETGPQESSAAPTQDPTSVVERDSPSPSRSAGAPSTTSGPADAPVSAPSASIPNSVRSSPARATVALPAPSNRITNPALARPSVRSPVKAAQPVVPGATLAFFAGFGGSVGAWLRTIFVVGLVLALLVYLFERYGPTKHSQP